MRAVSLQQLEGLGTSVQLPEVKHRKIKVLIKLWVGQRHAVSCANWENGEIPYQKRLLWFNPGQQSSPMQLLLQSSTVAVDLSLGVEMSQDTPLTI